MNLNAFFQSYWLGYLFDFIRDLVVWTIVLTYKSFKLASKLIERAKE